MKSLDGLSLEDKLAKVVSQLAESEAQNVQLRQKVGQVDTLTKANAQLEKKLDKANQILLRTEEAKSKLEELCRELQKMNKQIREDSVNKVKMLEAERQKAVEQLRGTLSEIERNMKEGRERSDSLADDNKRLAERLGDLSKEYEARVNAIQEQYKAKENYWEEYNKARDVEVKLLKTKLEASSINIQKLGLEKEELAKNLVEGTAKVGGAMETEKLLREQVKQYAEKYSELMTSLTNSNQAFDKFKKEIDRVTSNCKKIENDSLKWKQRYDEATRQGLRMSINRTKKIDKLESLCRALTSRKAAESNSESRPEESATDAVNQEKQAETVAPQDKEQTKTEEEQVQN
ncbi:hypothetical protein WR25_08140 [Diploscapter pachys]|uniref:Uncharacterized protein n=1 Tax=Diploscapter pachys TaxID=2018661 RepID=A0A2A2KPH0_9BILA|nr:hypothetical protein WR25_08140 [Diploscapter pachys]